MNDEKDTEVKESSEKKPDLTANEEKQVKERGTPRAAVVYETVREEGEFEMTTDSFRARLVGDLPPDFRWDFRSLPKDYCARICPIPNGDL